jgi:hypothetical protein
MLYEAPPFYVINGVSIMRDHADPLQFYYMPMAPRFVTRRDGAVDVPQLLVVKYRSATAIGGFADFDVHLALTEDEMTAVRQELQRLANLDRLPTLSPVPVVDGSVRLMLFGKTSGAPGATATGATGTTGATGATGAAGTAGAPATGSAGFVRAIHHAAKPALYA